MAVSVTEKAAKEVKRIMEEQKLDATAFLRLGVAGGGCSGFEYKIGFDLNFDPEADYKAEFFGLPVVVDRKMDLYLDGAVLDFCDDVNGRGFRFDNPNASKGCGCGKSFSA